jgi:multidrug resistance efflux pump
MKRVIVLAAAAALGSMAFALYGGARHDRPAPPAAPVGSDKAVLLAAPGRVEGSAETVHVAAGIDGVLAGVDVRAGDRVRRGDVLARVDAREVAEDAEAARHALQAAIASRKLLLRGNRTEARLAARQRRLAAEAEAAEARTRFERIEQLHRDRVVSSSEWEQSKRDLQVLEAAALRAAHDEALTNSSPLEEELHKADAETARARAQSAAADLRAQKLNVRAPIDGTILRILLHAGEAVSTVIPQPILTMADLTTLMVRAEVDEQDIARVWPGQRVGLTATGIAAAEFGGRVERVAITMGRARVRTGDPSEKSDRDIREVVIALDNPPATLPIGLRVTARFYDDASRNASKTAR